MNINPEEIRYQVLIDHITHLEVLDKNTKNRHLKKPMDILYTNEYKEYSKEDIMRIGYICGQISCQNK